ncbi:MAG: aldehyde dehydrogenase family protein, partial [Pseudomonadota bacterium]
MGKAARGTGHVVAADFFNPATGEVQAHVPLASAAEVAAAVENAKAAQPAWAATNPQKRARV